MKKCEWWIEEYSEFWDTSCGNCFQFNCDGPKENRFVFCPYCGSEIVVKEQPENETTL